MSSSSSEGDDGGNIILNEEAQSNILVPERRPASTRPVHAEQNIGNGHYLHHHATNGCNAATYAFGRTEKDAGMSGLPASPLHKIGASRPARGEATRV